jgi:uncharacterized membrane protein YkoI
MRIQYESQIESLTEDLRQQQQQQQQQKKKSLPSLHGGKGIATVPLEEIKTFAHAKEKIQ